MIDAADLDAAKRLAADLRSRGDERNAQVVEHLIAASGAAPGGPAIIRPPEYLTFRQAARALNVRSRTIKDWVATGKVRAVVANGQALVDRSSLLAYLDGLRPARAAREFPPADEATRQALLSLAYPGEMLQRLRELLDARQERSLSAEERAELDRLEEVAHRVSAAPARMAVAARSVGVGGRQPNGLDLTLLTVHHRDMNSVLATAATAFEQALHDLGFSGDEAELGDAAELGRRGALLAVSDVVWRRRLGPLLNSRQARELLGGMTRQAVSDLARRGRLLALPDERGRLRFPAFQFSRAGHPLSGLADILQIFAPAEVSSYTVASWFVTPQPLLDHTPPAQWLADGRDPALAIEAARRTAARLAQ